MGFAVAVILFEGGMNLSWRRFRREAAVIRRLLIIGSLVTALGSTLLARIVMGWGWNVSILFGTLVIVTGPTVITPLLRRFKVSHKLETILEAEGVLIDPIAAIVALQIVLSPVSGASFAVGLGAILWRLAFGLLSGVLGGFVIALLLRYRRVVPQGLENVFTLSLVLALFEVSNHLAPESGIMAVMAAGVVVGNARTRVQRDLMEFKEQLTVLFIAMLFVLLAADVRLDEIRSLGRAGVITVLCLMFLVRPLNILVSTLRSGLNAREKTFLSWLAPRGIVAAAVASLFAQTLSAEGIAGGGELRALVFLVIGSTVLVQGLTGGVVAQLLGLRRPAHRGYAILGANELGHALGRLLRDAGEEVVFLDSSPIACQVVERDKFKVIYGNAVEERTLQRAQIEERAVCIAMTPNEEVNLLFGRIVSRDLKIEHVYLALRRGQSGADKGTVQELHASVLFGGPRDLELWTLRMRRQLTDVEPWRLERSPGDAAGEPAEIDPSGQDTPENLLLPLVMRRGEKVTVVHSGRPFKKGIVVHFALFREFREEAEEWLRANGWVPEVDEDETAEGQETERKLSI